VFVLPLKTSTKLNVSGIAQRVIEKAVVWKTKNIEKCVIREEKRGDETVRILQTQKINIEVSFWLIYLVLRTGNSIVPNRHYI
jgi:hypothetical protein